MLSGDVQPGDCVFAASSSDGLCTSSSAGAPIAHTAPLELTPDRKKKRRLGFTRRKLEPSPARPGRLLGRSQTAHHAALMAARSSLLSQPHSTAARSLQLTPSRGQRSKLLSPPSPPLSLTRSDDSSSESERATPTSTPRRDWERPKASGLLSLSAYVHEEIVGGAVVPNTQMQKKEQYVADFLRVPAKLEPLLWFGALICFDAFLFVLSVLPLRVLLTLASGALRLAGGRRAGGDGGLLSSVEKYEISRGVIVVLCIWLLMHVDVSVLYHYIRSQSTIKLYVIYNMLEIFDRLCRSFGQDIFDSLLYAYQPLTSSRLGWPVHFAVCLGVVYVHALLLLGQIFTLNVAINSPSGFLPLLISNQFIELKANVFKRLAPDVLMSMTSADMIERAQILLSYGIIMLHNAAELDWNLNYDYVLDYFAKPFLWMLGSEILIDWTKHCFATRFNTLKPDVYDDIMRVLRKDVLRSNSQGEFMDSARMSSDNLGFVPLPLAIILIRTLCDVSPLRGWIGLATASLAFLSLLALKLLVHLWLLDFCLRSKRKQQ